jgi:hypothetical protein
MDEGVTEHLEFAGSPVQLRLTVCVEPARGIIVTGNTTELPSTTLSSDGALRVKSTMPAPDKREV